MLNDPSYASPALLDAVAGRLGALVVQDAPLSRFSTYRVAGSGALLSVCRTIGDLEEVAAAVGDTPIPVLVVGHGSNMLISDRGFGGLVVSLGSPFERLDVDVASESAVAGGAAKVPSLAKTCAAAGLHGLEWAVGIPGSVGGSLSMNAGAHGQCMGDVVIDAEIFNVRTGESATVSKADCGLEFRKSAVSTDDVVTTVRFTLTQSDPEECRRLQNEAMSYRRENHPGGRNTGSVFVNTDAWRAVKDAGADQLRVGCARVSQKHANFIVVDRKATRGADDVFELMCLVREQVRERTGIILRNETRLAGFSPVEMARISAG